ncbi:MAG: DNA integrity scanning diadenylate cyclase DisA [archaeon]
MSEKKEIQQKIIEKKEGNNKVPDEEFYSILRLVSPGMNLRTALDGIVSSGKGALIVAENEELTPIIDGGFRVNAKFSPQKLVELSKMDGAIVLSKDMKRINVVNVQLSPSIKIKTSETGTRHKAAERTAKQIGSLVIAVSERKKEITIFYKNRKHVLKNTSDILRKSSENIQILERQKELFENYLERLNKIEIRSYVSLHQAIKTIQKGKVIQKISDDLKKTIIEIGNEGVLLKTRLKEILMDVEKETNLIVKDYANIDYKRAILILDALSYEELLDKDKVFNALDCIGKPAPPELKGWRILSKTSLTEAEAAKLIREVGRLEDILKCNLKEHMSEEKAAILTAEIDRLKLEN